MIGTPSHRISVVVGDKEITQWSTYSITAGITRIACPFSLSIPFDLAAWLLCKTDRTIHVLIDGVSILKGKIDDRDLPEDEGEEISISGRDMTGRLVDESAPGINFSGLTLKDLTAKLAAPWFDTISFSNERNRKITRGRGGKTKGHRKHKGPKVSTPTRIARADDAALKLNSRVGTQIEPGQKRWQTLSTLLAQAGLLAWSSGDGKELIVGTPDYDQDIQYVFFKPKAGSSRISEASCLGIGHHDSTGDRYSEVVVVGAGTGTDANYGKAVSSRYGVAKNNPNTADGTGLDFEDPKRLIVVRAVGSVEDANELAAREMARRDAMGHVLTVRCAGHGQIYTDSTTEPTLFVPDTLALVEDERTETRGIYLVTECVYESTRKDGETTKMTLIRSGSDLSPI
jgi:prophage tail gpP-like protein